MKQTTQGTKLCPYAKKCGGCQLQNMDYPRQLNYKQSKVVSLLGKFNRVNKIIGMDDPYHYRNKVQAAFGLTRSGKVVSGVYQSSTHRIVNVDSCMIEDKKADEIIVAIRRMLPKFQILPYNEDSRRGFLRHVLVKRSFQTNQIMVVLVGATPIFPQKNRLTKELLRRFPEITTVVFNINPHKTSMLLGEREEVLYGKGYIEDELCGMTFRISPRSFYQINSIQTQTLYNTAIEYAGLTGQETVLDAYCGTGTIGLVASPYAKQVIGVELNPDAVRDAKINAKINGVKNAVFCHADAGQFMTEMTDAAIDVVFMDPPRAGSDRAFLESVITLSPKRIVYISCNPETQKRDLFTLTKGGYRVKKIQPVDMFPHTNHVETVVKLVRKKPDAYIDITVDMDELDLTASEAKATYKQIKDYIFEKHNVKVSSLYIAQVKQKYGIIERENYNKPADENARQPKCPPEKEVLIEEALRHFKMIL